MSTERSEGQASGLALLCGLDGRVQSVLADGLAGLSIEPGQLLSDMVFPGSEGKARAFLQRVVDDGAANGWELILLTATGPEAVSFAGGRSDDTLFILASSDDRRMLRLYEELVSINNEQANALRFALKDLALRERSPLRPRASNMTAVDGMMKLNNELLNTQRELAQQNMRLASLNEQKNSLLGMAAHDLRNPLSVIRSYAQFILEDAPRDGTSEASLTAEHLRFIGSIKASSDFMLGLVEDLLDVSRIEAGRMTLDIEDVDLIALLADVVELNATLASPKGISVRLQMSDAAGRDPRLTKVSLDPQKIRQVVNNLITNAVKFSAPDTTVTVGLDLGKAAGDGDQGELGDELWLSVRDEGQGIPADEVPTLFEMFQRTSVRSTAGEKSTGLGLAIVQQVVVGHSGRIEVDSVVGEGTTFKVCLPILQGEATPLPAELLAAPAQTQRAVRRVLVVDDNPVKLLVLRKTLERRGLEVSAFTDGHEALAAAREERFELAFSDVEMPGMSGQELAERLRRLPCDESAPPLPIVAVSGHDATELSSLAASSSFDDFMTVPVKQNALSALLCRLGLVIVSPPGEEQG